MDGFVMDEAYVAEAMAEVAEDYADVWLWECSDERARELADALGGEIVAVVDVVVGPSAELVEQLCGVTEAEGDQDEQGVEVAGVGDVGERSGVA